MNNHFLFLLSAAVNQSTGAGFADGAGRLKLAPVGRGAFGELRVPVLLGPIWGAAFI